ncbi:MAG: alkaline phosphatase [Bacteroidales bacterium]|nr:alkaline phosphatase [Bacteroidales bacterium]
MKNIFFPVLIVFAVLFATACQTEQEAQLPKAPKNIILLIGDGMGVSEVYAGLTANGGSLNLEKCTHYGYSKTHSASGYVTDSGAGGTAISTGVRTYNGAIGVDTDSLPLKTILEFAEEKGLSTGLVSTSSITHATPASFISHQKSRNYYEAIAADFLKTDVDVIIGGGRHNFMKRADSVNLIEQLIQNGYAVKYDMEDVNSTESGKLFGLTADAHNPRYSEGRGDMLPEATETAVRLLSANDNGFFLMVEGSMIDWGGHANDIKYITEEMLDFDRAVGEALKFAEADGETLIVITADHETGGLGINGGDFATGEVIGGYTTKGHTGVMVPVFAFGPGADAFAGIQKNTDLFDKMMKLLKLNDDSSLQ